MNISNWTPEEFDFNILTSWLLSNPLSSGKNRLARLTFKKLNWEFNKEVKFLSKNIKFQALHKIYGQIHTRYYKSNNV